MRYRSMVRHTRHEGYDSGIDTETLARAIDRATTSLKHPCHKDKYRIQQTQDILTPDLHGHGISTADVIIKAIYENLEAKQTIFKEVDNKAKKRDYHYRLLNHSIERYR